MSNQVFPVKSSAKLSLLLLCFVTALVSGCAVAAKSSDEGDTAKNVKNERLATAPDGEVKVSQPKGRINIAPNTPADAIRTFYKNLREKRFREAMLMTNLRSAVEGLTEAEMEDLRPDFEPLANQVPAEIEINGEIITNNLATVTTKMPNEETGVLEEKIFRLRLEKDSWVILTVDEAAENIVRKEGKNYFFSLRLDTHHVEANNMMERVAKAQMVYALQNAGLYADMPTLIAQGLLPEDAQNTQSTGYRFSISPSSDRKKYMATAEPAVYGKTGKLSFLLELNEKDQKTRLTSKDNKGQPLKK
jgi:hypothetical protein